MTPLQFTDAYAPLWRELEALLAKAERKRDYDGARLATLYRRVCEHLALAQARVYPVQLIEQLEAMTQSAHRLIYRQHDFGVRQLSRLLLLDFPQAVRAHRRYLAAAALLFVAPLLAAGWACWRDPGFILHLMEPGQVHQFDEMYGPGSEALGRARGAGDDFQMFGYYIMHNIGIGLNCFGAGVLGGVLSALMLLFNGVQIGGVAGYVVGAGYAGNFFSFVVTHGAFELTAIVLAGAAGMRLGWAWVAPGRYTRLESLRQAARHAVVLMYGVVAMLLVAAALEAFWSSSRWLPHFVKYGVAACCWLLVLAYLVWQGRSQKQPLAPAGQARTAHAR
jgi:uncharacterized membrane protein SpoIIM required for sporulation